MIASHPLLVEEELGDLHRVERGALAQVVGYAPQVQAVLDRAILTDTRDEGGIVAAVHVSVTGQSSDFTILEAAIGAGG